MSDAGLSADALIVAKGSQPRIQSLLPALI